MDQGKTGSVQAAQAAEQAGLILKAPMLVRSSFGSWQAAQALVKKWTWTKQLVSCSKRFFKVLGEIESFAIEKTDS